MSEIIQWKEGMHPLPVGVYAGVPASVYHADPCERPSLSSSVARVLAESSPLHAHLIHPRLGNQPESEDDQESGADAESKQARKKGAIIHELLLGGGQQFEVLPAEYEDFRTKAARAIRDEAYAAGKIPIIASKMAEYQRPADLLKKQIGPEVLELEQRELTVVWEDDGVLCRSRFDFAAPQSGMLVDIKTVGTCDTEFLRRKIVREGMDIQAHSYSKSFGAAFPEHAGRTTFEWVFCEFDAPYDIVMAHPSATTLELGRQRWEAARDKWRECLARNEWPGRMACGSAPTELDPPEWEVARMVGGWS